MMGTSKGDSEGQTDCCGSHTDFNSTHSHCCCPLRPLIKTIVEFQMSTEVQALIRVERSKSGPARLNLSDCSSNESTLRLSLLHK